MYSVYSFIHSVYLFILFLLWWFTLGLPYSSDGKESACNAGDPDSIPGSGRSPEEVNGNPLQHSCLENSMDRGAWKATVHRVTKNWTQLSTHIHQYCCYEVAVVNISDINIYRNLITGYTLCVCSALVKTTKDFCKVIVSINTSNVSVPAIVHPKIHLFY